MSERGSGILDAIAATAIGLLLAHAAADTVATIRGLAATGEREQRLVTARNVLEHVIAVPCAPPPPCPGDVTCDVETEALTSGPPPLARVRVSIAPRDGSAPAVMLTGVRAEACT